MKSILLAAAAFIATPIIAQSTPPANTPSAQTTPSTTDSTAPADGTMQNAPQTAPAQMDPAMQSAPAAPADQAMQSGTMTTGSGTTGSGAMATGDSSMTDPAGGYQPSQPAISGTAQPGQTVRYQPAQSPDQAYPAPAPMASYPVCKKGQYDNCREGGSGTTGRKMMRHRRK